MKVCYLAFLNCCFNKTFKHVDCVCGMRNKGPSVQHLKG